MDDSCNICKIAFMQKDTFVYCSRCSFHFHIGCAGIPERFYKHFIIAKGTPWYCHICNVDLRKQTQKNTEAIDNLSKKVDAIDEMKSNIASINIQMNSIRSTQETSIQVMEHEILDKVNTQLDNFASKWSNKITSLDNDSLFPTSSSNTSRRKNVIIRGVPEIANELVTAIVKKIAKVINFNQSNFIDNCFRLPNREQGGAPGSIILKFNTEISRDEYLKCYFGYLKNHPLTPSNIGLVGNQRIFVNEHMDPRLRLVLKEALQLRKNRIFSNVSTHCNHISVKNADGWHRVHTLEDLNRIQHIDDNN